MAKVRKRVPMFDPRPRKANGTLDTKMSRERYIKMYGNLGWMNVEVPENNSENNPKP